MHFVDAFRAGKRVCIWTDKDGKCNRAVAVPKQDGPEEYIKLTKDGEVMPAGTAVHKGYLTYAELKEMFPRIKESERTRLTQSVKRPTSRTVVRTFTSKWGLTDELYPRWKPVGSKGGSVGQSDSYLVVEERRTTFKVVVDDEHESLLSCSGQVCTPYKPGRANGRR